MINADVGQTHDLFRYITQTNIIVNTNLWLQLRSAGHVTRNHRRLRFCP
jgi:hypothetical protein